MKGKFNLILVLAIMLLSSILVLTGCNYDDLLLDNGEEEIDESQTEQKKSVDEFNEDKEGKKDEQIEEEEDIGEGLDIDFDITSHVMEDLEGNEIEVPGDLEERVLIKFWQSTCPVCIEEMDEVQEVYEELSGKDDRGLYTVNVMEDRDDIQSILEDDDYNFPVLMDKEGSVMDDYSVMGFPVAYIVDQDENVLSFQPGPMSADEMLAELEEAETE